MFGRRGFLKALSAAGIATVTPITMKEIAGTELVLLRPKGNLDYAQRAYIRDLWLNTVKGTSLEHTKAIVLEDVDIEFVRKSS